MTDVSWILPVQLPLAVCETSAAVLADRFACGVDARSGTRRDERGTYTAEYTGHNRIIEWEFQWYPKVPKYPFLCLH